MSRLLFSVIIALVVLIPTNKVRAQAENSSQISARETILKLEPVWQSSENFLSGYGAFDYGRTSSNDQDNKKPPIFGPGCRTYNKFFTPIGSISFGFSSSPPPDLKR